MPGRRKWLSGRGEPVQSDQAVQAQAFWGWVSSSPDPYGTLLSSRRNFNSDRPLLGLSDENALLSAPDADPLLALGVPGSGKSTSATVVNALMAPAAMFSTSARSDVYLATALARGRIGRVWSLSASGKHLPNARELRWSPIQGCQDFEYAQATAKRFADYRDQGASARAGDHGQHPHFRERSAQLLAVLFFYAAHHDEDMQWVFVKCASGDAQALVEIAASLKITHRQPLVAALLEGIITSAPQELSGVMSTATRAINCYSTDAALRTQRDPNFDFKAFVRGEPDSPSKLLAPYSDSQFDVGLRAAGVPLRMDGLYDSAYIADGNGEAIYTSLYLEFIHRLVHATYEYAEERNLAGLPPALNTTLVLDELYASPVPDIGSILAQGRGRQLTVIGAIQSLRQAKDLYGLVGEDFLSQWRCSLVYRGILDEDSLRVLSLLSGTFWAEVEGRSQGRNPRNDKLEWTSNVSLQQLPRLTEDQIRLGHPFWDDGVLLVRKDSPHMWVHGRPFFRGDPWVRVLVNSAEHAYRARSAFPLPPLAQRQSYQYLDELGLSDRYRKLQEYERQIPEMLR